MRLASYALRGRPSFGVVVSDGIVDLRPRLHRFQTLSEVFRAQALDQAIRAFFLKFTRRLTYITLVWGLA